LPSDCKNVKDRKDAPVWSFMRAYGRSPGIFFKIRNHTSWRESMKIGLQGLCGLAALAMLLTSGAALAATTTTMPLWAGTPPKALGTAEKDTPTLTVYLPEKADGKLLPAILVCPGGGYGHLALTHEGSAIGQWCNSIGVAAFVLKYTCPPTATATRCR
jgi:acetyl esterase/lipase